MDRTEDQVLVPLLSDDRLFDVTVTDQETTLLLPYQVHIDREAFAAIKRYLLLYRPDLFPASPTSRSFRVSRPRPQPKEPVANQTS